MKTVVATMLAKPRKKLEAVDYYVGFHHLIESLRRHNTSVPPIVVLSPDIKKPPPGVERIVRIDERRYEKIENVQMAFGKSVYFKLDLFRLLESGIDADRIIYFDSDVVTFSSVDSLWDESQFNEHGLYGIRESSELGLVHPDWQGRLNAGVLIINRPFLKQQPFDSMLQLARTGQTYDHGDQGVINAWLSEFDLWSDVGILPPQYNMPSCVRTHGDWNKFKDNIQAMHYLGPRKPWRNRPDHEWFHEDTQQLWDDEIRHHAAVPKHDRPNLASSLHTRLVRLVQRYEIWTGKKK